MTFRTQKRASPWKTEAMEKFVTVLYRHDRPNGECWAWPGAKSAGGYGLLFCFRRVNDKDERIYFFAHRLSFEFAKGKIPYGQRVMHACDRRDCFNPSHLFLGTQEDNMRDMARKGRGHNQWPEMDEAYQDWSE